VTGRFDHLKVVFSSLAERSIAAFQPVQR